MATKPQTDKAEVKELLTSSKQFKQKAFIDFVVQSVCTYYKQDVADITYTTRKREFVKTRQVVFYIVNSIGKISSNKIAKHFGFNHGTILHALKVINGYMSWDKDIKREITDIISFMTPKIQSDALGYDLNTDFYYIGLDNFTSIKQGGKAIILTGFTDNEIDAFVTNYKITQPLVKHTDTRLYILEDRKKILRTL